MGLVKASAMPLAVPLELNSSGPLAMGQSASSGSSMLATACGAVTCTLSGTRVRSLKPELLAEAFVIAEEKRFVLLDRASERSAELLR